MNKKCYNCGELKSISEFYIRKMSKDGHTASCKLCVGKFAKERYDRDTMSKREEERQRLIYRMTVEKICAGCKIIKPVSEFNKDKNSYDKLSRLCKECRKKQAALRKYNPIARRKSYLRNKKQADKYSLEYQNLKTKNDPGYRINKLIRSAFVTRLKNKKVRKNQKLLKYTNVPIKEYIIHLEKDPLWEDYKNGVAMHIDHIIPCAAYDFIIPEDIARCWNPLNLRLLPAKENMKKSDKIDMDLIIKHQIEHLLPTNFHGKISQ